MTTRFTGGCLCGAVRYEATGEPEVTLFCHCTQCQKETGSAFSAEIILPRTAVTIEGAMTEYDTVADSGNKATRKFCPICGCPILLEFERADYRDTVCISVGSLDDASSLQPQAHCFTATKQPWVHISDDLPQFEGDMQS